MRRLVRWIVFAAAAAGASGCATAVDGTGSPAESGASQAADQRFVGRWYALDANMSCQPDKVVTFADGQAILEGQYSLAAANDAANAQSTPLTLPYRIETDAESGLPALVVRHGESQDRYWLAGPDFLLALNADGYDVLAHCD